MTPFEQLLPDAVKPPLRKVRNAYRRATAGHRALPDFIVIGAMKAGTTSLYDYLKQHPRILPSLTKEVHFFDGGLEPGSDDFRKGEPWYRSHFPLEPRAGNGTRCFEASPLYIFHPLVPSRMHRMLPDVKLVAVLRNPTERAISHYFHERRKNRETLDILAAMRAEEERLAPVLERAEYGSEAFIHHSYKLRGHYADQLGRYLEHFDRERLLVIESESMFADPGAAARRVFDFVGVDPEFELRDARPRNVTRNRIGVEEDVYAYLDAYFEPRNRELGRLLGRTFDW